MDKHFKTMERWFRSLNDKLSRMEHSMATKEDVDKLHELIERVHRRVDEHLSEEDKGKRLYKLAIERLDEKVNYLQSQF